MVIGETFAFLASSALLIMRDSLIFFKELLLMVPLRSLPVHEVNVTVIPLKSNDYLIIHDFAAHETKFILPEFFVMSRKLCIIICHLSIIIFHYIQQFPLMEK